LNLRPLGPEPSALAKLSYAPVNLKMLPEIAGSLKLMFVSFGIFFVVYLHGPKTT